MCKKLIKLVFSSLAPFVLSLALVLGGGTASASRESMAASTLLMGKGIVQLKNKNYVQAIKLFEQTIVANPENAQGYSYLGRSYQEVGNPDRAYKYYDIALSINPEERKALSWSGEVDAVDHEMDLATEKLARLERICGSDCAEYQFLQSAINESRVKN